MVQKAKLYKANTEKSVSHFAPFYLYLYWAPFTFLL